MEQAAVMRLLRPDALDRVGFVGKREGAGLWTRQLLSRRWPLRHRDRARIARLPSRLSSARPSPGYGEPWSLRTAPISDVMPHPKRSPTPGGTWERLCQMDRLPGYLFRVGQTRGTRSKRQPILHDRSSWPEYQFEPALPAALAALSERQRLEPA